jgi:hypothetical protein
MDVEQKTNLLPCPLCGSDDLVFSEDKSPDKTITWHRIHHGPYVNCGLSLIDSNKDQLIILWNQRTHQ